jgi:hypothetical protein
MFGRRPEQQPSGGQCKTVRVMLVKKFNIAKVETTDG